MGDHSIITEVITHAMRRYSSLANYETGDRRSILAREGYSLLAPIAPTYRRDLRHTVVHRRPPTGYGAPGLQPPPPVTTDPYFETRSQIRSAGSYQIYVCLN